MAERLNAFDVFETPQTVGDLWDELNRELVPFKKVLNFRDGEEYVVRLLGPFMLVLRSFNAYHKEVKNFDIDLNRIANQDASYFSAIIDRLKKNIAAASRKKKSLSGLAEFLFNLYRNEHWQKCIMTNAYIKEGDVSGDSKVKVLTLTKALCKDLAENAPDASMKISGFKARDLSIERRGSGTQTRFRVSIKNECFLSENAIQFILANGLIDIPSVIESINAQKGMFYYKLPIAQYRMPAELTRLVFTELKELEEIKHLVKANEKINEVPKSAFEKVSRPRGIIDGLELP